jgi:hypothetical protein
MGRTFDAITDDLRHFIEAQPLFFVASAPLAATGHVNLSPKGLDTFRVLSPRRVAYLDLTGSGNETAAHVGENGRITFMFCAFTGAPRILRLYGRGSVVLPYEEEWEKIRPLFGELAGIRQIIVGDLERVQLSCGFGVPLMEEVTQRDTLLRWAEAKGPDGLKRYRKEKNMASIDGIRVVVPEE